MKLVETQTAVFNTISAKSDNQHSNTINQSSFSLPSNSLNENSHKTKQLALQEHQHPPIALPCSSQLHEISHPIQTPHQHCVKSVRIRCYSGPYFPAFGLNTERYGVSLRVQSECGKMRTRITSNTDTFYAMQRSERNIAMKYMYVWANYRKISTSKIFVNFLA